MKRRIRVHQRNTIHSSIRKIDICRLLSRSERKTRSCNSRNHLFYLLSLCIGLLSIVVLVNCNSFSKDNPQKVFELVFTDGIKRNPKIVFQKEVNLDLTPEEEFVYIIRNGNEEILVVLNETKKDILFKKVFTLLNIGPIVYDPNKNKWVASPAEMKQGSLYIIKSLLFTRLANDMYDSIFLEILSEEPPLDLFSVPLVFRNYNLVFDGFTLFKDTKLLKELNRIPVSYIPERNGMRVLSTKPSFDKFYGLE